MIMKNLHNNNHGFTLVEVMVAMVIFAIGMMGMASLQTVSIRTNYESNARSQAVLLAYDMVDRMRANVPANGAISALAAADQAAWQAQTAAQLPGGLGVVAGVAPNFTITVHWDEDRTGANGTNCPPLNANDLRCFRLSVSL